MSTLAMIFESDREYQSFRRFLGIAIGGAVVCVLFAAPPARGQRQPPDGAFVDRLEVHWVLIPVVVREDGRGVEGLTAEDLSLTVDGRPVPVATLGSSDEPASLVWLQDLSGSMATLDRLELARDTLLCLADSTSPEDELLVAGFSDRGVRVDLSWSAERALLTAVAAQWQAHGETALVDALAWLPELTLDAGSRRLAVVVTDGRDNASRQPPDRVRAQALELHLPLYFIDLSAVGLAPHLRAVEGEAGRWLGELAERTGGRVFHPRDRTEAREACQRTASDLRSQYVVGFVADPSAGTSTHDLEIRVSGGRRTVSHRPSYLGPPPSATFQTPTEEDRP